MADSTTTARAPGLFEAARPAVGACPMVADLRFPRPCAAPATRRIRLLCDDGHSSYADVCPDHDQAVRDDPEAVACLTCRVQGRDSAVHAVS